MTEPIKTHIIENWRDYLIDGDPLTSAQKSTLKNVKAQVASENATYLRDHPQLKVALTELMKNMIAERPANSIKYIANFFTADSAKHNNIADFES